MQLNALSQDYISSEKHPTENWFDVIYRCNTDPGTTVLCLPFNFILM
jgi:hypothetical protein